MEVFKPWLVEPGKSFTIPLLNTPRDAMPIEMIWVPPGKFMMGCSIDDTKCYDGRFEVTLTDGFWLSRYPVTISHWNVGLKIWGEEVNPDFINHPVQKVNWYQIVIFFLEMKRLWN